MKVSLSTSFMILNKSPLHHSSLKALFKLNYPHTWATVNIITKRNKKNDQGNIF